MALPGNQAANRDNKQQPAVSEECGLLDSLILNPLLIVRHRIKTMWHRLSPEMKFAVALFIATRICLFSLGIISQDMLGPILQKPVIPGSIFYSSHSHFSRWVLWDGHAYMDIADQGYRGNNFGFLPAYPLLVRMVAFFTESLPLAGIVVSNIFLLLSCMMLTRLLRLDYDEKITKDSLLYLFLLPGAFMLSGIYTESLFLFLTLACMYCARKEHWWRAGLCATILISTKIFGIFILVPLLYFFIKKRGLGGLSKSPWWLFVIPLGPLGFGYYCWHKTGDCFAYIHIQQALWHHQWSNPISVVWNGISSPYPNSYVHAWWIIITLAILIVAWKHIPKIYVVFGLALIVFPPVSGSIYSSFRYSASFFVLPLSCAAIANKYPFVRATLPACFALIQGVIFVIWVLDVAFG